MTAQPPGPVDRCRFRPFTITVLAIAACLTASCTTETSPAASASSATAPSPRSSPAGAKVSATFVTAPCPQPNYPGTQALDFAPTVACGYLTVPEDRSKPTGRSIRLAVARVPAVSGAGHADPVVYLQGGPGESAMLLARSSIKAGINAERDVIYLEQRGNYAPSPTWCVQRSRRSSRRH